MGGAGFEPAKAVPPDLQSGPFGRLGIHPLWCLSCQKISLALAWAARKSDARIPYHSSFGPGRAGGETRTHNPRFTKPMLCRLSYASNQSREIVEYISRPSRHARVWRLSAQNECIPLGHGRTQSAALNALASYRPEAVPGKGLPRAKFTRLAGRGVVPWRAFAVDAGEGRRSGTGIGRIGPSGRI
jgi:hypothetical protein